MTPASFGSMLAAVREKRGLSIQDAAHETRIHPRWLRLIEEGNIAAFGNLTYARSFVRAYSSFLEVDPSEYLQTLPPRGVIGGKCDYRYLVRSHGPWVREKARQSPAPASEPTAAGLRRINSPVPAGLGVFALMLTATAMWGMHVAEIHAHTQPEPLKPLPMAEAEKTPMSRYTHFRAAPNPHLAVD
ncbi:MAG: helix-turn-helix domain-containing protein [Prosthecobacter sp.]